MTPQKKQSELQRYRAILLAALDSQEERLGGSIVYDEFDPVAEYYQQQKAQTEKYFEQGRLDRLKQKFERLTTRLQNRPDLNIAEYIKEQTGYDIDIFEGLRKRVSSIIEQNEIRSQKELIDIAAMLQPYHKTSVDEADVEKLKELVTTYFQKTGSHLNKANNEHSEVISRIEKDGIETVTMKSTSGPKPKHFEELETVSPDGKRRLHVTQWSDGKHSSTYVTVIFPTASGTVYGTNGIHPEIKAWWKNNSSIVIETKKEYVANTKNKKVRSFEDEIAIDYIEH